MQPKVHRLAGLGVVALVMASVPTGATVAVGAAGNDISFRASTASHIGLAVISSTVLAAVAISIAVRLFGNEAVMFRAK